MNYGPYPSPGGYPPPPPGGYPPSVPPHWPVQGYPQNVPPQGQAQGYPQNVPSQGQAQGYPQNVPPQGQAQGYPQNVPPQGQVQGYPQNVPPQGQVQGYPQNVPPQGQAQGYPQSVPPQGQAQAYPQGVPFYVPQPGGISPYGWYGVPANYPPPFVAGYGKPPCDPRKKGAARTLNRMCLLVLAQTGLSFFWQFPLLFLMTMVGVDIYTNGLGYQWLSGILVPLSTALPFVAYLVFRKKDPSDYLKFEKVGFSGGLLCVLGGLAITLLGNYPAIFISNLLGMFGYSSSSSYVSQADSLGAILLEIAVVAVLVPFMEELVFRGVILSSLRKYGIGFSIVASGLVFGLAHLDVSSVVFATIAGLVFGFLYAKTNNLWLTILIHGLNNFIATFGSHTDFFFGEKAYLVDNLLMLVPIGAGILSLVFLALVKRDMFLSYRSPRYDGPRLPLNAGDSAKAIVRAPVFWVIVGVMVVYTVGMFFAR